MVCKSATMKGTKRQSGRLIYEQIPSDGSSVIQMAIGLTTPQTMLCEMAS